MGKAAHNWLPPGIAVLDRSSVVEKLLLQEERTLSSSISLFRLSCFKPESKADRYRQTAGSLLAKPRRLAFDDINVWKMRIISPTRTSDQRARHAHRAPPCGKGLRRTNYLPRLITAAIRWAFIGDDNFGTRACPLRAGAGARPLIGGRELRHIRCIAPIFRRSKM